MTGCLGAGVLVASSIFVIGCKGGGSDGIDTPTSPQASAIPAALQTNTAIPSGQPTNNRPDGGPPPQWARPDEAFPVDAFGKEKEPAETTFVATFRTDAPMVPKHPEMNAALADSLRRKSEPSVDGVLSPSRLRLRLTRGFVVRDGTEIRARRDHYGHLIFHSSEKGYRVASPGSLRSLFEEGRVDVGPLNALEVVSSTAGSKKLGLLVRHVELSSRAAKIGLDLARLPEVGEGGMLLCRFLLDLVNASPQLEICRPEEMPVRAEFRWNATGILTFEVGSFARREGGAIELVPPAGVPLLRQLSFVRQEPFAGLAEAPALHAAPQETGTAGTVRGPLQVINHTDAMRILWLDGVPLAPIPPGSELEIPNLFRGKYVVSGRTWLGDRATPLETVVVPGHSEWKP